MNKNRLLEIILFFAIVLAAALSAYTTQEGILILTEGSGKGMEKALFAWSLAILLSILLIYISYQIPEFQKRKKLGRLVFSYVAVASLSLFFNFNSFYGWAVETEFLEKDAQLLQDSIRVLENRAIGSLDEFYKYSYYSDEAQILADSAKWERLRPDRRGCGRLCIAIKTKLARVRSDSTNAARKFLPIKTDINEFSQKASDTLQYALRNKKAKDLRSSIGFVQNLESKMLQKVSILDNFQYEKLDLKSLDASTKKGLNALFKLFKPDDQVVFAENEKEIIAFSFLLGFLLDFPIFFLLVILRSKDDIKSMNLNNKENSEDEDDSLW